MLQLRPHNPPDAKAVWKLAFLAYAYAGAGQADWTCSLPHKGYVDVLKDAL